MGRSKKVFIPIIIGLIIITGCIVFLLISMSKNKNNNTVSTVASPIPTNEVAKPSEKPDEEEIDLSNVDEKYSDPIIAFAEGLSSTKGMETFQKKYLDSTAFVAYTAARGKIDRFLAEYEKVTEEDAKDIEEKFKTMISKNNEFKVISITDIVEEENDEDEITFATCDFTLRDSDGKEAVFTIVFFHSDEDEIVINIMDKADDPITAHADSFLDYFEEVKTKSSGKGTEKDEEKGSLENDFEPMSQQEKDMYNAKIRPYIAEEIKGSEVKSLIDNIISMNQDNIGNTGKFIGIRVTKGSITNYDEEDALATACNAASIYGGDADAENSEENVQDTIEKMTTLKSKINSQKTYNIEAEQVQGIYTWIVIQEAE